MQFEPYSEMWKELCFILRENIKEHFTEKEFEFQVVRAMELLGWSEYKGEIERQLSIHIGSGGKLRPDLVIYDNFKKPLIVVEVKRPQDDFPRDEATSQLKSYMRQMKAEYGILVGLELRVYYDGPRNPQTEPLLLDRISFSREEESGAAFVRMFTKNNFTSGEHSQFLDEKINSFNVREERRKLLGKLLSDGTKRRIIEFLSGEFSDFGKDLFADVMNEVEICVTQRSASPIAGQPDNLPSSEKTFRPPKNRNTDPIANDVFKPIAGRLLTLEELTRESLGKDHKPKTLVIDNKTISVSNWTELTTRFVEWLIETNRLTEGDLPILSYSETKYFIARSPEQKDEKDAYWNSVGRFFVDTK